MTKENDERKIWFILKNSVFSKLTCDQKEINQIIENLREKWSLIASDKYMGNGREYYIKNYYKYSNKIYILEAKSHTFELEIREIKEDKNNE